MTACVNETKKTAKGGVLRSKIVRAVMAAVLAIGLMPGVALADEASPRATDDQSWTAGVPAFNQEADENDEYIFDYTGKPVDFKVTGLTAVDGTALEEGVDYEWAYFTDENGTKVTTATGAEEEGAAPVNPGTYYIGVYPKTDPATTPDADNTIYKAFIIKSTSLDSAVVYQVNGKDLNDVSDTTFTYTGGPIAIAAPASGQAPAASDGGKLWVAIDGKPMKADEVSVAVDPSGSIQNAGAYKLKLSGSGTYARLTRYVDITVSPFDLSTATITVADGTAATYANGDKIVSAATFVNGNDTLTAKTKVKAKTTAFSGPSVSGIPTAYSDLGKYTVSFSVDPDVEKNVVNTGSASFVVADAIAQYFEYSSTELNGTNYATPQTALPVTDANPFMVSNIKVDKTDSTLAAPLKLNDDYTVTVTKDGATVTSYTEPGLYKVDVNVKTGSDYKMAGSRTFYFKVNKGTLGAANVFVSVDGKNVEGTSASEVATYTGEAHKVTVVVKDAEGKNLVEGTDYEVAITDGDNKAVDSVVNAGEYTVKVTSDSYVIASTDGVGTFKFEIGAAAITGIRVAGVVAITTTTGTGDTATTSTSYGLPYTGAAIVPTFEYTTDDVTNAEKYPNRLADESVEWKTLPAEAYEATYTGSLTDKQIVKVGEYTVALKNNTDEANETVAANFDVANCGKNVWGGQVGADGKNVASNNKFNVIDAQVFADVPVTAWYAQVVSQAAANGYMNGYYGTKLFGPGDEITRADVACVLFNMAGGTLGSAEGQENVDIAFATEFSDVNANMYYARAIGWAAKNGVVSGYGDGTFGPEDKITREQFAAMLCNYAKAKGEDVSVDAQAVLEAFDDADQVSEWAEGSVAWCVSAKVMGNGGYLAPSDTITRAEVAAMAINYQPEEL